ncbi:hypothetical protein AB0G67_40150 [Streptomyces sp. NPDC021056]|uniref:hypothetical protein n=1 Tax=Streptomyces sp. NPDC021056 TaxID=3155012 RepID=UPI0033FABC1A
MAVMTHARTRPEADYRDLTAVQQNRFDQLMEKADNAGPHDYQPVMGRIADLVGLPEADIRKCGCSCVCPVIFDSEDPDAHVIEYGEGYNLGRHQCPTCADRHRETA